MTRRRATVPAPVSVRLRRKRPFRLRGKGPAPMEHLSQPDQAKQVLADEPLTTKEGWARFVDRRPTRGALTGQASRSRLSRLPRSYVAGSNPPVGTRSPPIRDRCPALQRCHAACRDRLSRLRSTP